VSASSPEGAAAPASAHAVAGRTHGAVAAAPGPGSASSAASQPAPGGAAGSRRTAGQVVRDIVLFFVAPYVTMAYLAMFPFVAMKMLAQARRQRKEAA